MSVEASNIGSMEIFLVMLGAGLYSPLGWVVAALLGVLVVAVRVGP